MNDIVFLKYVKLKQALYTIIKTAYRNYGKSRFAEGVN